MPKVSTITPGRSRSMATPKMRTGPVPFERTSKLWEPSGTWKVA